MAIAEVTIVPIGTGSTSVSAFVADIQKVLAQQSGVSYQMTSMSTIIEGPLDRVLEVIRTLHEVPFQNGAMRVSTSVKIDDRRDKDSSSAQKLRSVADKM